MVTRSIITLILSLPFFLVHGQTSTINNAQAIAQKGITFYDTEGYSVFLEQTEFNFDEKGIKYTRKKFAIPKEIQATEDADFPNTKILTTLAVKGESKTQSIYYLSANEQGKLKVVCFSTLCERDKSIEKEFYQAVVSGTLPKEIFTTKQVAKVRFCGREMELGPACHWMGVRNLQCPDMGQMNWSEFSSPERAKQMTEAQKALNSDMKIGDVLEDTEVEIVFEGQTTKAIRRKLKIKIPQFIMGGSNILIIYYVTTGVRDRYVSCVLSHYTDDIGAKKLPPLLAEVMQLKE